VTDRGEEGADAVAEAFTLDRLTAATIDEISTLFAERVEDGRVPGSVFALFDSRGASISRAFGVSDIESGELPHAGLGFRVASCTKSFTAATALLLRDRGLLSLDARITEFVPAFRAARPSADPVVPTVRMLMTMAAGLPTDDPWGDRQESLSVTGLTELLRRGVPFSSVPGTAFEYSNLGYALLGQVIESVTGMPYIEFVERELLKPLGLEDTSYDRSGNDYADTARGYRKSADGSWITLPYDLPGTFSPIGGVFTTARDLAVWAGWLSSALDAEAPQPGPLSAASRREMQQLQRLDPIREQDPHDPAPVSVGYGFGLFVREHARTGKTVFHSGGYPGFGAHMRWHQRSGLGIVAVENATYSGPSVPATAALDLAVEQAMAAQTSMGGAGASPWPETTEARRTVEGLLREWDDAVADRLFAENVALDMPFPERRVRIEQAISAVAGLDWTRAPRSPEPSESPAHLVWRLPARRGRLRLEILLTPTSPPLVQTLKVTPEVD
jgi:CubicO group peptidase (beta-lactamase class C family)